MRRNYYAKNVVIIGILAYPKINSRRKRGNRGVPLPFRGKRARTAHIMWGNH